MAVGLPKIHQQMIQTSTPASFEIISNVGIKQQFLMLLEKLNTNKGYAEKYFPITEYLGEEIKVG